ncbi:MAG: hypothetical protein NC429_01385 [Lachnospiraceae bacterium]|nr:hypothetical protein [Lachnospiraceae bacterium]
MSKVSTDKKLELIRTIRMQNQYNRQLFKSREDLIYSDDPSLRHGEIYGLESAAYPVKEDAVRMKSTVDKPESGSGMFRSFRIRFLIAMGLFLAFVYCDIRRIPIGSVTTDDLYRIINEDQIISELIGGLFTEK